MLCVARVFLRAAAVDSGDNLGFVVHAAQPVVFHRRKHFDYVRFIAALRENRGHVKQIVAAEGDFARPALGHERALVHARTPRARIPLFVAAFAQRSVRAHAQPHRLGDIEHAHAFVHLAQIAQ